MTKGKKTKSQSWMINHHGGASRAGRSGGHSMQTFRPEIDYQAKWHRRFDKMMDDSTHKKRMAKVTLPSINFGGGKED